MINQGNEFDKIKEELISSGEFIIQPTIKTHPSDRILTGFSTRSAMAGENLTGEDISTKGQHSSLFRSFKDYANEICKIFDLPNTINEALVIIRGNTSYTYTQFPLQFKIIVKDTVEEGHAIFQHQVADYISLSFKDHFNDVNPLSGDKVIWIFRVDWVFGLYYDFTGTLEPLNFAQEACNLYKKVAYIDYFRILSDEVILDKMIKDGWFPFIELINNGLEHLNRYYENDKLNAADHENLLTMFTQDRINHMVAKWWNNSIFENKKAILESGIDRFHSNDFFSTIKNLSSEIEGIIRLSYPQLNKKTTMNELKEYIADRTTKKFYFDDPLCLPTKFKDYLNNYFFKNFEPTQDTISCGRHSVSHGLLATDGYTKTNALKLLLILDSLFYIIH